MQVHRVFIGLIVTNLALAGAASASAPQEAPLVVRGGHLFTGLLDVTEPNPGILIQAGKIMAIGAEALGATGATMIDLGGDEYVVPGLIDLHAHHAIDLFGEGRVDERAAYPLLFLANGVTTVFPAGEMDPVAMRELRLRLDREETPGPRLLGSGPYFGSWRQGWDRNITADSIATEVDYWASTGVSGFKAKGITGPHLRALIQSAHRYGLPVTGHLDSGYRGSVNPRDAILMGIDRVEHFLGGDQMPDTQSAYASLVDLDPHAAQFDSIAALYIRHNVFFDATLTAYGYYGMRDPDVYTYFADEKSFLTPYMREIIEAREPRDVNESFERIYWVKRRTVKAFYDAGGAHLITLGTDHPSWGEYFSGFAAHRELHALVLSGIPPADALRAATINGARAMHIAETRGTLEPGKLADLFVVQGNPLTDIRNTRNVRLVMRGGSVYSAAMLLERARGTIGPRDGSEEAAWRR